MKYFLILLFILIANVKSFSQSNTIRFDGFYQSETIDDSARKFFRFYKDGTVIVATTSGEANEIIKWFKKELYIKDYDSKGNYGIELNKIYFSTSDHCCGTVVYEGDIISEYKIKLRFKSLINGYEGEETYCFIKINNLE